MKIGLDTAPAALRGTYFQHLASVLARYAPEHEYIIGAEVNDGVDLYHGFRSSLPLSVHLRRVPSVMTVPNLNFLRYPQSALIILDDGALAAGKYLIPHDRKIQVLWRFPFATEPHRITVRCRR